MLILYTVLLEIEILFRILISLKNQPMAPLFLFFVLCLLLTLVESRIIAGRKQRRAKRREAEAIRELKAQLLKTDCIRIDQQFLRPSNTCPVALHYGNNKLVEHWKAHCEPILEPAFKIPNFIKLFVFIFLLVLYFV